MAPDPRDDDARVAPTSALDHALDALASGDAESALRWAVPALTDVGADAPALDLVARAAHGLGDDELARTAFDLAVRALAEHGMASHAVAAALGLASVGGADRLGAVAGSFASTVERKGDVSVRPPPLASRPVEPLDAMLSPGQLLAAARTEVGAMRRRVPASVGARAKLGWWGALPRGAFERFARALTVRVVPHDTTVIAEGEAGASAFVLGRGGVRVARGGSELARLGPEAVFGEMALLTAGPRQATVATTRACLLLEAPRAAIDRAVHDVPPLGAELASFCRRRLVENLLRTSPLLRALASADRATLARQFETREVRAGETLIAQGDDAPGLHLLASGHVDVVRRDGAAGDLLLARLGPGDCVGEISLVLRRPATADVVAREPAIALVLRPERFLEVVHAHPTLLASLYEIAVARSEETRSVVAQEADEADDLVLV